MASSSDPLSRTTSYNYDGSGNVITTTDPSSRTTNNSYDNDGELISTIYSDAATAGVSMTYGAAGQKLSMTDGSGTSGYSYDSLRRLTSQTNGAGTTTGYSYDIRGELTSIGYPGSSHTVNRTYGDDGEMTGVTDWNSNNTTFSYDPDLNFITTNYANGVTGQNSYDNAGRVTNIGYTKGSTNLASFGYARTTGGDVTGETDSGSNAGSSQTFTYNTLGQLASQNGGNFGYDSADNLTNMSDGSTLAYDHANEVTSKTPTAGAATTYVYDSQGNRTGQTMSGATTNLGYDQANRLTSYGTTATYQYDGGGLRTSKTVGGTTQNFTYDQAEGLPQILDDGNSYFVYGPDGTPVEQISHSGTTTYLHQDQLGSTRLITDSSGNAVGSYQFDAYGNTASHTGTNTPLQYAGQYLDTESGLYWMRARYYDPISSQFVTKDKLFDITGDAYAYVSGDPTDSTDPSGMFCLFGHNDQGGCRGSANEFVNQHPQAAQAIVDVSAGYLNAVTFGQADTFIPNAGARDSWNTGSIYYAGGQFGGGVALGALGGAGASAICERYASLAAQGYKSERGAVQVGRTYTPDQQALNQLAQSAQRTGINSEDAETLMDWSREYGFKNTHGPEIHPNRSGWASKNVHIHAGGVNHIPIVD